MSQNVTVLGVITARAGSKRLPGKNYADLGGKPLIQWTIESAVESNLLSEVVVTTDCPIVKDIASKSNVEVIERPEVLASDSAKSIDVILHVFNELALKSREYDYVVLLQPTSPFRTGEDVDLAFAGMLDAGCNKAVSVCKCEHSPLWSFTIEDGQLSDFIYQEATLIRSQDLPDHFRLNGAIYIARVSDFYAEKNFTQGRVYAYLMPQVRSIDIDSELDLDFARFLVEKN